jgi:hypothetical protein
MFTWFDKFIACSWMFLILAFGTAMILGNQSTVRIIEKSAGILVEKVTKTAAFVNKQVQLGLMKDIEVQAFGLEDLGASLLKAAIFEKTRRINF